MFSRAIMVPGPASGNALGRRRIDSFNLDSRKIGDIRFSVDNGAHIYSTPLHNLFLSQILLIVVLSVPMSSVDDMTAIIAPAGETEDEPLGLKDPDHTLSLDLFDNDETNKLSSESKDKSGNTSVVDVGKGSTDEYSDKVESLCADLADAEATEAAVTAAAAAAVASAPPSHKHSRSESPTATAAQSVGHQGGELHQPLAGGMTLIHDGPPIENLPGGWAKGWRQRIILRKTGGRKGPRKDNYFYTPTRGYELLGIKKVRLYLQKLKECNGDEDKALENVTLPEI
jgi:hypothetical protein